MKKITFTFLFGLGIIGFLALQSCQKETSSNGYQGLQAPELPTALHNYTDLNVPIHFIQDFGIPIDGEQAGITDAGATLGRVLFYDKKLSLSNEVSCGSCHFQSKAFSDGLALSEGIINNHTPRNSQAIINPIMQQTYFWDSRVSDLEKMVLMPIQNHNELGMEKLEDLVHKLGKVDYYAPLFEEAFGDSQVSKERIASSLTQFLRSMFSADSKFDQARAHQLNTGADDILTDKEKAGRQVFNDAGCNGCHGGSDLRGSWGDDWANIGLDVEYEDNGIADSGIFGSGGEGMFKVPSLRNIALTSPYMHDGRFNTLMDVINHYSEGIQDHPNLDWRLVDSGSNGERTPKRIDLTATEKENLITFLQTFTDQSLITDERFSDPFTN